MKTRIVEHLGQTEVLLPSLIRSGLAANDRAKLRMTALQAAAQHAIHPADIATDLSVECRTAGVDPHPISTLISGAKNSAGNLNAPGLSAVIGALLTDIDTMIEAVNVCDEAEGNQSLARGQALKTQLGCASPDQIALDQVAQLTSLPRTSGDEDTVHRLVMDLHRSLNRLAAACAEEVIAGAHAYGLTDTDRALVGAFMRGLERTRRLKFDHPGLDTTATRSGTRLVIQIDLGTTDAHVLVVTVEDMVVTITYTDVHRARAQFFMGLFEDFPVRWSGLSQESAAPLGEFCLVTGCCVCDESVKCESFLEAIGAALVFIIDWNKARKVLRTLVGGNDAVGLLNWAAREDIGHRAFLELGGADLVASAIRHVAPARIGFGEQLETVIGREAAIDFLKAVLRVSTETLLQGLSVRLAKDAIEAELVRHLDRSESRLLALTVQQAGLGREIAVRIVEYIADRAAGRPANDAGLAEYAKRIEEKGDRLATEARRTAQQLNAQPRITQLIDTIEQAIDELEQAAFTASLMPADVDIAALRLLTKLCWAVVECTQAAATGLDAAAEVPEGRRADSDDVLSATNRLTELEHACDAAERAVTTQVLRERGEARTLVAVLELARALERSSDRFAGVGHLLHAQVMAHLSA